MAAKRGLGKGLDALFDSTEVVKEEKKDLTQLRINMIEPNRKQPRQDFDEDALHTLSESIKKHGLIQPIIVAPQDNGFYKIIAGERRWRACKMAGLTEIPVVIRTYEKQKAAEVALLENLQREDLNPIEEAFGYKNLMEEFSMTQDGVAEAVGKSRPAVANALRLLSLSDNIIKMVREGLISGGHARALLAVDSETERQRLAEQIIEEQLSVRQTEKLASEAKKSVPKKTVKRQASPELLDLEKTLSEKIGSKVKISNGPKKGKIEIEYYGNDDLNRVLEKIGIKIDL
ncbi:MAG: ParB/RepB/Spo0J family partition protein [Clostridia bacterium]|nr:ParB/RepB/Spo0J family partition protein [Clostridia bacterium]